MKDNYTLLTKVLGVLIGLTFLTLGSFLLTSGLVWAICWAFEMTFTWKLAFGVYLVIVLINLVFTPSKGGSK